MLKTLKYHINVVKLSIFISVGLLLCFFLTGCKKTLLSKNMPPLSRTQILMGTPVTLTLYEDSSTSSTSHSVNEAILNEAFEQIQQFETLLSANKEGTLLDEINLNAGIKPVQVDPKTYEIIEKGLTYSKLSNGAFDITIGPLTTLWHIGFEDAKVPTQEALNTALSYIDYHLVTLNPLEHTVYLQKKGMQLDLGGIAKGYVADVVTHLFKTHGIKHALLNLGGNIYTLGYTVENNLWNIGIQDPFSNRGESMGYVSVANQSIVTSGIYERFLETEEGTRYHHILDSKTGYPVQNTLASVTIISPYSTDGDALSTIAFSKGLEEGLTLIEGLEGIEAIFITKDYKVYTTSGIQNQFTLTNPHFSQASLLPKS